ncbi:MAG TPA: alpha/beta hydrolase [Ktedonobacterales bacterium]|nr:alpha/beta hydrolase [Ktedonobacterales bacterium]
MSESNEQSEPILDELIAGPGSPPFTPPVPRPVPTTNVTAAEQRGFVRTIHYNLSYIVRNAERGGAGAIVLLHDLPGGAFIWTGVLPALDASGRAVYAFDMLGYGDSDHPWPSDTSVWGHADNLTYAFQALGLSDIVLIGIGVGAATAQVLATRTYYGKVAKLALINTYAYEYAFAPSWPLPDMEKRHDPEAPKHTPLDAMLADLRTALPQGAANSASIAGSKLDAYLSPWNGELGKEMLFQHIRLMLPLYLNSVGSDLKKLTIPVQILWGEQDNITPLELGRRLAREIPGATLSTITGAGHLALDDAPDAVAKLLTDFARR